MRRTILTSCAFLLAFLLGGALTNHVWVVSAKALQEAALAQFITEQEFLAVQAHTDGQVLREAVHRLNAADAQAEHGFRWLQRIRNSSYTEWSLFPWTSYWPIHSTALLSSSEKLERGRELVEAQYRARAATALERFGAPNLAEQQWGIALRLQPAWSKEEHREFVSATAASTLQDRTATAYLDSSTSAELVVALEDIRAELGAE